MVSTVVRMTVERLWTTLGATVSIVQGGKSTYSSSTTDKGISLTQNSSGSTRQRQCAFIYLTSASVANCDSVEISAPVWNPESLSIAVSNFQSTFPERARNLL